ncbi:MAG: hypothetical protein CME62_02335 [Halobacteriovoraceae bacterium]|nr:hypothetical protein [Halobacteriovoraceae bacterium]|tara:strand:+ start:15390 stop:15788 length:399 start_codon:yes stop_codon:yes gene_type:complete
MDSFNKKDIRILIVDDSDFSRTQIAGMLSEYNVVGEVASAKEAISILADTTVHLAIVDIVMPEVSGIELADYISTNYDKVAIIMISSLGQENIIIDSISAGASDFLQKPIKSKNLISSIDKLTEKIIREKEG